MSLFKKGYLVGAAAAVGASLAAMSFAAPASARTWDVTFDESDFTAEGGHTYTYFYEYDTDILPMSNKLYMSATSTGVTGLTGQIDWSGLFALVYDGPAQPPPNDYNDAVFAIECDIGACLMPPGGGTAYATATFPQLYTPQECDSGEPISGACFVSYGPVYFTIDIQIDPGGLNEDSRVSFEFSDQPFSPTPEPANWAVMALGLGGVGAALRRSRRRRPTCAAHL